MRKNKVVLALPNAPNNNQLQQAKHMKLYIFDFDGTLGDSRDLIVRTMMDTLEEKGLAKPTVEACVATIGLPLAECFEVAAHVTKEQSELCATRYKEIFRRNNVPGAVKPFANVIETLNTLHQQGKVLAVASSRQHESLDKLISDFGITHLFSAIIGADDVENAKPAPESVNKILAALPFSPNDTIMIGDAPYDILMGKNAGVATCGVTYGNGKPTDMQNTNPDFLIDDFAQLLDIT